MSFLNRFPGFLFSIIVCKRGGQEFRLTQDTCCLSVRNARALALMDQSPARLLGSDVLIVKKTHFGRRDDQ